MNDGATAVEHDCGNPLDTPEQRELELQALDLLGSPLVRQASDRAAVYWRDSIGPVPVSLEAAFAEALDQACFTGVLASLNLDASRPRVHSTSHWPHTVAGRRVPASMTVAPNPDATFRNVPVDGVSRYVISGRFTGVRPAINEYSLLGRELATVANLSGHDLAVEADGTFRITLDPHPPQGRRNHIQTTGDAVQLLVRDILADWAVERPGSLSIDRVEGPPLAPTLSGEEREAIAAESLLKHVRVLVAFSLSALDGPPNTPTVPRVHHGSASAGGSLSTQAYSRTHFQIDTGEALMLRISPGGASYVSVALNDIWSVTCDASLRTCSFNHTQAAPDADGDFTVVIAAQDPGIFNWLDTAGDCAGIALVRWAGFDTARLAQHQPSIDACLVRVARLPDVLPPGTRVIDADGRRAQIAGRARDLAWRLRIGD